LKFNVSAVTALRLLTFSVLLPLGGIVAGLKMHMAGFWSEQLRSIGPVEQLGVESEMPKLAASVPRTTVVERRLANNKHVGVPLPERATVSGLLEASVVTVSVPVLVPTAVGWNLMLMAQLMPAARLALHRLVWENSALVAMLTIVRGPLPVLVSVTVFEGQSKFKGLPGKFTLVGERLTAGTGAAVCKRTETVLAAPLAVARSSLPSPLKSPLVRKKGTAPVAKSVLVWKVPSPLPSSIETVLEPRSAAARSNLPSPLKSPRTTEMAVVLAA
jgi:hypothetical protein